MKKSGDLQMIYIATVECDNRIPHVEMFTSIAGAQMALPRLADGRSHMRIRMTPWRIGGTMRWAAVGDIPLWTREPDFFLTPEIPEIPEIP